MLDDLRRQISSLERLPSLAGGRDGTTHTAGRTVGSRPVGRRWLLGIDTVDDQLAPDGMAAGLDTSAVHEVKPDWGSAASSGQATAAACRAAALGFTLTLAGRLDAGFDTGFDTGMSGGGIAAGFAKVDAPILWCTTRALSNELGACYGPGLKGFGIDPGRLLVVETTRADEVLWALEEGLTSGAIALAIGLLDAVAATPARRLTLAAAAHATPCLLLTHPTRPPALTAATRWRVGPAPSAAAPFDARSPGAPRFAVRLERCRARPLALADHRTVMEWCDATFRFRLATGSGDRAAHPHLAAAAAG